MFRVNLPIDFHYEQNSTNFLGGAVGNAAKNDQHTPRLPNPGNTRQHHRNWPSVGRLFRLT